MYLIQIFLPLKDNNEKAFPQQRFNQVRDELVDRFKGLTAY